MSGKLINNPLVMVQSTSSASKMPSKGPSKPTEANTEVYFWYLDNNIAANETSIPLYTQDMPSVHDSGSKRVESVVNSVDGRTKVDREDYEESSGRFRGIVKLFLLYDGQLKDEKGNPRQDVTENNATWAMASGWLAAENLVITAGHCAFNHSSGLGRLVKAKAYVGYSGKEFTDSADVEFSTGYAVATTREWINTVGGDEAHDVSFIKLSSPFKSGNTKYNWKQTPISQHAADLGVVGYPGDIINDKGERGATMYKMFKQTDYNLTTSYLHMLQYQIDTYGGNSGSPVFSDRKNLAVIGVHVLGGHAVNSASTISGPYGNRFQAYFNVTRSLDQNKKWSADDSHQPTQPEKDDKPWLWRCYEKTIESLEEDQIRQGLKTTFDKAKSVLQDIPKTILDSDHPISFGSEAGPQISILAAAAIAAAGRLASDNVNESNAELAANTRSYDGILGRAILAETALQCFLEQRETKKEAWMAKGVLGPVVAALKPVVLKIAPKLLRGVIEPSMRLLLSNMRKDLDFSDKRDNSRPLSVETDTGFGRTLTREENAFLRYLKAEVDNDKTAFESFFGTLTTIGDVIGSAFKKAGPVLADVVNLGLPLLLETGGFPSEPSHLEPLAHRAILAEACLQAYVADPETAKRDRIFEKMVPKLKLLGPRLLKAAPFVVKFVGPIVADILREVNDQKKQEFLDFSYGKL